MDFKSKRKKKAEWEATRWRWWLLFLHLLAIVVLGASLFPMVFFFYSVWKALYAQAPWIKVLALSFAIALGYFIFGVTLIFLCVLTKNLFGFKIKPGVFSYHSDEAVHWAAYNSLILIANSAFLDVLRLSPFQTLFYRLMGAKIGRDVEINTAGLADLAMLEIGDGVMIGGGVALICHAADRGHLILAPTKIGNKVSIGMSSIIMPDCHIGDGASIAPMSYLPKGTKIPANGLWGGNPLRDLRLEKRLAIASDS